MNKTRDSYSTVVLSKALSLTLFGVALVIIGNASLKVYKMTTVLTDRLP